MHYHLLDQDQSARPAFSRQRLAGYAFLLMFLVLAAKVWLPYASAVVNATAIVVLPPRWAESYMAATLPKAEAAKTGDRLVIRTQSLAINAPIVTGVDPESLLKGVGWDAASAKPGEQGRVVISGHRFWPNASPYATVFFSLDRLKVGDVINLTYGGEEFAYRVTESWDVPKDKATPQLAPTNQPILTIYTCGPTPYSAKNRLGFNAVLDQSKLRQESRQAVDALQAGLGL